MASPIISARGISKCYRLGLTHRHDMLRERIAHSARAMRDFVTGKSAEESDAQTLWALKDVSFEIEEGTVVGVVGRNGAGKSTLLKILSRITEPTHGEIRVRGRLSSLLEVGTGFHPELTGRENIFLNGAILGMTQAEVRSKLDAIIAFAEVEKFLDTPIKRYSSGMYVRLAFAVAAHLEPEILVLDEVLAVGDAQFQTKCLGKMGEVAREGRTVIFVSHSMTAVSSLCQSGMFFEQGQLKQVGPIQKIVAAYMGAIGRDTQNPFDASKRAGTGLVRITNMEIGSDKGANALACGSKMMIRIHYEATQEGLPIQFSLAVFDSFNSRILILDNNGEKNLPRAYPIKGQLLLEFPPEFSLFPGRYTINPGVRVNGEIADFIWDALVFDVQEGDFFGSGKFPESKCAVLYRNKWTFCS